MKLAIALFALSSAAFVPTSIAFGQTPAQPTAPAKPATHAASSGASTASGTKTAAGSTAIKTASTIPRVPGIPKTMYALKYIDIKIGTGPLAEPQKYYTVNYTGWFPDGKKFDSSLDHKEPFTFPYGAHKVIVGWDTGFEGMRVGGKRRLYVPYQLAYGQVGRPPQMPAKANLIFDVELVSFSDKPPAPLAPPAPRPSAPPPAGSAPPATTAPAPPPATPPAAATPPAPAAAPASPAAQPKPVTPPPSK
jgi:peptidylprolyl isomerase